MATTDPLPSHSPAPGAQVARGLAWGVSGLLALLVVIVGGLLALGQTDGGRLWLKETIESAVSAPDGLGLRIGALDGALPGQIILRDVALSDPQGVWLTLGRAEVLWSPLALLGGRLSVEALRTEGLAIARPPALPSSPEDPDSEGFDYRLLARLRIGELAVPDLSLGEALVGEAVRLALTGRLEPAGAETSGVWLTLDRTDGKPAHLGLVAEAGGAPLALSVDLAAHEPEGGIVARLLGLEERTALALDLKGQGPLADWRGQITLRAEDLLAVDGPLTLARSEDGALAAGADLRFRPLAKAPPRLRTALAPEATVSLRARDDGNGGKALDHLGASGPGWTLTAKGALGKEGALDLALDGALQGAGALGGLVPNLGLGAARVSLRAGGSLEAPTARAEATINALDLPGAVRAKTLTLIATAQPEGAKTALAITVGGEDLSLTAGGPALAAALGPAPSLAIKGLFDAPESRLTLSDLALSGAAVGLGGTADLDLEGAEGKGLLVPAADLTLTLPDLALIGQALGRPLAGRLDAHLLAEKVSLEPRRGRLRLEARGKDLAFGGGPADRVFGPAPGLIAGLSLGEDGAITLDSLALDAPGAVLTGQGGVAADGTLDASLKASLADLGAVLPGFSGSPSLEITASGPLADAALSLSLRADRLAGAGIKAQVLDLTLAMGGLGGEPAGVLEGSAKLDGQPVTLSLPFALKKDFTALELWQAELALGSARLGGDLAVDLETRLSEGALTLAVPSLAVLKAVGAPPMTGSLTAKATLDRAGGRQGATISLRAPQATLDSLAVGRLTLDMKLADALGKPTLKAEAGASGGAAGGVAWKRLSVKAEGALSDLALTLALDGSMARAVSARASPARSAQAPPAKLTKTPPASGPRDPLSARLVARLALTEGTTKLRLTTLDASLRDRRLSLLAPATLTMAGEDMILDRLRLSLAGGELQASGSRRGGAVKATLDARAIPLSLADLVAPDLGLEGRLDGRVSLSGSASRPTGEAAITLSRLKTKAVPDRALEVRLDATLGARSLDGTLSVAGFAGQPLRATASLPRGAGLAIDRTKPLTARADWRGDVRALMDFTPLIDHRLSGATVIDILVTGSIDAPIVSGGVSLKNGAYENLSTGTVLREIALALRADGGRTVTIDLDARDGGKGRVSLKGRVLLADLTRPIGRLDLDITEAVVVRRDDAVAEISADLAAVLAADQMTVSGTVTTGPVEIRLVGGGGPSIAELDVVEIGGKGQATNATQAVADREALRMAAQTPIPVLLDITVSLPRRVYVRGRGVDSEWEGKLSVGGTAAAPKVVGTITTLRGQADVLGRTFSLRKGEVRFDGGMPIDPQLDVVAANDTGEVVALVSVSGPASDPQIGFSSEPALPEDEVISQILFGKTSGELSAFEAIQLAEAASQLAGVGGGGGVIQSLRTMTGLDVLKLGEGATGGTTLEAGTYLRENVYIGVEQGLGLQDSAIEVQVELTPSINLESKVGATGASEAGVFWKKDY
ncbi:translocation/assembly module TamB [Rhodospirillum rubrum]|uniref:translocation/assembly module TamB domain-containing protein n=1 Tax=Rhodospirillum rubrum TaxID=1085 RepID=UPI00190816AE|nr:translocation/assembly module TamB domain-containing protein [Rhodospirillum rubrum]MBK1664043.1 translocation/assembly module TamB [Rhodospirillum rubrum]MBK1675481.1 translocation/assembly module TamB [Rhodospirillum rubrum]